MFEGAVADPSCALCHGRGLVPAVDDRLGSCPSCSRVHLHLYEIVPRLPTDYADHGGKVIRWADGGAYPDCSCGCFWALWLDETRLGGELTESLGADWLVCTKPGAPRCGLLTFEHQAGHGCFEPEGEPDDAG